jgi:hypothetical protein
MGFFQEFDEFYLLTETTPSYPFPQLPNIVSRAKQLLINRTRKEIISAANIVEWFIDEHFIRCKDRLIQEILTNEDSCYNWVLGYLPQEDRNESGICDLLDTWPSGADNPCPYFSSSDNTSELTALRECIEGYSLDDDVDFPNAREFEYFAVLAWWLVGESLMALPSKRRDDFSTLSTEQKARIEFKEAIDKFVSPDTLIVSAGKEALEAMNAICYAEHLYAIAEQAEDLAKLRIELHQASSNTDMIVEDKLKQKVSLAAKKSAIKRHRKSKKLKEIAVTLYMTKTWPSVRQASKNIYPQLLETGRKIGFVFSPERGEQTVYEWLLKASKEMRKQADV